MLHKSDVTESLARFIVSTRWEDIPAPVRHQARRSLMNFFAVALAGCRTSPVEIALRSLSEFTDSRQATVVGRPERVDVLSAAFLNAASANVHDYCDTHLRTVIHPTAPVAPAVLALAEWRRLSGHELLLAFILGNEIQARIGLAISPSHYNRGWHITSTCGVFGAAAGAGKLAALDERQMVWALGNAATQSAGLCECLGTPAKSLSVGNAARNGLWSALLAEKGFDGPPEPLAGRQGFYNALAEAPDLSLVTDGLGESWEIMATSYKPYPCGFVIHPVLDCVLDWRRDHPAAEVARTVVRGNPLLAVRTDRPDISTGRESQVSVQHAVAAALVTGKAGIEEFTDASVNDPKVRALRGKVTVERDEAFSTIAAAVEITTADGKVHRLSQAAARGSDVNPLDDTGLEEKLRTSAAAWDAGFDATSLISAVWALDRDADVPALMSLAVPR
ncbi:MAG TPA: MmgE/PrpD family protein [Bradyrhizobium sp.]|uniref:MmgE/PrpD family protein n=1 Tax=Bradyrhizobium sp. TaxID=376 RepID=UPI002C5EF46C|nr:MmgE/PrpD family protein [Bradyrhizobium sp.]HTB02393.1 MmgE/PrpD family protein [Bradyrhizobium sp.]